MTGDRVALARHLEEAILRSRRKGHDPPGTVCRDGIWLGPLDGRATVPHDGQPGGRILPGSAGRFVRRRVLAALLYAAGQIIAYVGLALRSLKAWPRPGGLSAWLQQHVNQILGPVWILTAMVLLGLIHFRLPGVRVGAEVAGEDRCLGNVERAAVGDSVGLGFLPRISHDLFCRPVDDCRRRRIARVVSGDLRLGRGVARAGLGNSFGPSSRWLGSALNRTQRVQLWLNRVAGGVLLAVGVYYALRFNFEALPF